MKLYQLTILSILFSLGLAMYCDCDYHPGGCTISQVLFPPYVLLSSFLKFVVLYFTLRLHLRDGNVTVIMTSFGPVLAVLFSAIQMKSVLEIATQK